MSIEVIVGNKKLLWCGTVKCVLNEDIFINVNNLKYRLRFLQDEKYKIENSTKYYYKKFEKTGKSTADIKFYNYDLIKYTTDKWEIGSIGDKIIYLDYLIKSEEDYRLITINIYEGSNND